MTREGDEEDDGVADDVDDDDADHTQQFFSAQTNDVFHLQ